METELPKRKANRLPTYDYAQSGAYFITICTRERQQILWADNDLKPAANTDKNVGASIARPQVVAPLSKPGKIVEQCILQIPSHYQGVLVEKYAVMPNHVHLLLLLQSWQDGRALLAPTATISQIVQQFKGAVTKHLGHSIWQKSFHDHVIRTQYGFEMIWQYIDTNPQLWHKDCFYKEPPP